MAISLRYGQKHIVDIDVSAVLTKLGKTDYNDIVKAIVTLKESDEHDDDLAAYNKNSVDHSSVVMTGTTDGATTVSAVISREDFDNADGDIQSRKLYYVGCGLVVDGEDALITFEPDEYSGDQQVRFVNQRVDTLSS